MTKANHEQRETKEYLRPAMLGEIAASKSKIGEDAFRETWAEFYGAVREMDRLRRARHFHVWKIDRLEELIQALAELDYDHCPLLAKLFARVLEGQGFELHYQQVKRNVLEGITAEATREKAEAAEREPFTFDFKSHPDFLRARLAEEAMRQLKFMADVEREMVLVLPKDAKVEFIEPSIIAEKEPVPR